MSAFEAGPPMVILVVSGKGGVGKSTVSLGLSQGLGHVTGHDVGLIDADIDNPCLQVLGGAQAPDIGEFALSPQLVHGVKVYSPGAAVQSGVPFLRPAQDRLALLSAMVTGVDWEGCRFLLIDTPPGASTEVRGLIATQQPAGAVIVTHPSRVSFEAIRRTHSMLQQQHVPVIGVVENMSGGPLGAGAGDLARDTLGIPLLSRIPMAPNISASGDQGEPMPLELFGELTQAVLEWESKWRQVDAVVATPGGSRLRESGHQ